MANNDRPKDVLNLTCDYCGKKVEFTDRERDVATWTYFREAAIVGSTVENEQGTPANLCQECVDGTELALFCKVIDRIWAMREAKDRPLQPGEADLWTVMWVVSAGDAPLPHELHARVGKKSLAQSVLMKLYNYYKKHVVNEPRKGNDVDFHLFCLRDSQREKAQVMVDLTVEAGLIKLYRNAYRLTAKGEELLPELCRNHAFGMTLLSLGFPENKWPPHPAR